MKSINLKIQNNTPIRQGISILGVVPNPLSANNINNLYSFDLSQQNFTAVNSVTIIFTTVNNPTPTTLVAQVLQSNIQGVVDALNTLGVGVFTFSGSTIYVQNDFYIYSNLVTSLPFVSSWDTTQTSIGSSGSNQVALPLKSNGNYNFFVDWGDGNTDQITLWNQPEVVHTYSSSGIYTITIDNGFCEGFAFEDTGDKQKIRSITSFGDIIFGDYSGVFYGCTNLDLILLTDVPILSSMTSLNSFFRDCTSISAIPNIDSWNVSNILDMSAMFSNTSFNDNISSWNVSSVQDFSDMFGLNATFNSNIGSWNVSNALSMNGMFSSATAFNQDIGLWNISNVLDFVNFMFGKTDLNYSSANLDSIYNNWSLLSVQPNLTIDFGTIKYTLAGQAGRDILTNAPNNWTINDGGI
jgi:surface protein